jgi:hypothetical protein
MFLNPFMLIGLAAVGIPVAIHLLTRGEPKRVAWAAMRFLRASVEKHQRKLKLEDLILMLLRALWVLLLVLFFARLFWPAGGGLALSGQAPTVVALVIDSSASMKAGGSDESVFELARTAARSILGSLPQGSACLLIQAAERPLAVVGEPSYDLESVRRVLEDLEPTDGAADLPAALQRASELLEPVRDMRRAVVLLTDGQIRAFRNRDAIQAWLAGLPETMPVLALVPGQAAPDNLGVTGLEIESGIPAAGHTVRVLATVHNHGRNTVRDVPLTLLLNEVPAGEPSVIGEIPSGRSVTVPFYPRFERPGPQFLSAVIGSDPLLADNTRTLAVDVVDAVRVLLVAGRPGGATAESDDFFLRNALAPVAPSQRGGFFIRTTVVPENQFAGRDLDEFDVVILSNVARIESNTAEALSAFVRKDRTVIVFPGPATQPESFHEWADLPARLGEMKAPKDPARIAPPPYGHALLRVWNDESQGTLTSARFQRYFLLNPDGMEARPDVVRVEVARFREQSPAVMESRIGRGSVLLFASTGSAAWNDLPARPAFLPLLHAMVGQTVRNRDPWLNLPVGGAYRWEPVAAERAQEVLVWAPGQPPVTAGRTEAKPGVWFEFAQTWRAGGYRILAGRDESRTRFFATAMVPEESDLARYTSGELAAEFPAMETGNLERPPGGAGLGTRAAGWDPWLPLLVLLFLLALGEIVLAQRFSRSK